jgi:hypothetical protein
LDAIERIRIKHVAYFKLFGSLSDPTPLGAVVLADLDAFCTTWRESIHIDSQGRMDPYTTIYRDGKKAVALRIREMINWSEDGHSSSDVDGR